VHSHPKEADLPALLAELCDAGIEFIVVRGTAAHDERDLAAALG
jgi:hypothetical protein